MNNKWEQSRIQGLINDKVEESLKLEYKAAGAIDRSNNKKAEITKDVSAMANSAGGTIIYGVKEYDKKNKRHLPEKLDGINRLDYSREWLEQVIGNIQPRIDGLIIHPVTLDIGDNQVAYVVEIPQSNTAHQATNYRYYKRYNFESVPMQDFEIRDIMGRQKTPKFRLSFFINIRNEKSTVQFEGKQQINTVVKMTAVATNIGQVFAKYVNIHFRIPILIVDELAILQLKSQVSSPEDLDEIQYYEYGKDNTVRDIVDVDFSISGSIEKYGPARYQPILPGLSHEWNIRLNENFVDRKLDDLNIEWTLFADNAPPDNGSIPVDQIKVNDNR
jgi:hypothetical protein